MLELKDTGTVSGVEYQTKIEQVVKVKTKKNVSINGYKNRSFIIEINNRQIRTA